MLTEFIRQRLMSLALRGMNLASQIYDDGSEDLTMRARIGCWLEDRCHSLFAAAYAGSQDELDAVWNGEIPPAYMNARQRALLPQDRSLVQVSCCQGPCRWWGTLDDTVDWDRGNELREEFDALHGEEFFAQSSEYIDGFCPCCGHSVNIDGLCHFEPQLALPAPGERIAA